MLEVTRLRAMPGSVDGFELRSFTGELCGSFRCCSLTESASAPAFILSAKEIHNEEFPAETLQSDLNSQPFTITLLSY